jgi:Mg/Co/Ni transporter MgtE
MSLRALSRPDLQTVPPDAAPRDVARLMTEYNLPDLPVVDEDGQVLGLVLIDDAIDAASPNLRRRPRLAAFGR